MKKQKVLVLGATGLVGSEVLKLLSRLDDEFETYTLTRRPLSTDLPNKNFKSYVQDLASVTADLECFKVDAVICAFGTTIKKARSQEEFKKIDYEYPLKMAKFAKEQGAKKFLLVSSLGADSESSFFYNKIKGLLENEIKNLGFRQISILRPSVLVGPRAESRPAEAIAQKLFTFLPAKWRGVAASKVAAVLVKQLNNNQDGYTILENTQILANNC